MTLPRSALAALLLGLALVAATLAAYLPVLGNDFVNIDDYDYVKDNPGVQAGLSAAGIRWAFAALHSGNWHPLTWLSLQLDYQLFGLAPAGYHLHNLLLHAANAWLLFEVLRRLTGAVWRSALVAALFALHPLHVESVAWVAERKDVLSTLFFLLTLGAYAGYAARPGWGRYALVMLTLALGLLAKPMLVTTPCVLLLLDYWPLRRPLGWRLLVEKLPLFALAAASCVVTVVAQQRAGYVSTLEALPLGARVGNALVAYVRYLGLTFWPADLVPYHPHPGALPLWQPAAAALLLGAVSLLALWQARRRPYLVVGWLWYLGTLVPVIGLVQVASQSLAERYTYVPLVGVFLMLTWGAADLVGRRRELRVLAAPAALALLFACGLLTWLQAHYWHDSVTLWRHTVELTRDNYVAYNYLGSALWDQGEVEEAVGQFERALEAPRADPSSRAYAESGIADGLLQLGRTASAVEHYEAALRLAPQRPEVHAGLGTALLRQGNYAAAAQHFQAALRLGPVSVPVLEGLAQCLDKLGRPDEAAPYHRWAAALRAGS